MRRSLSFLAVLGIATGLWPPYSVSDGVYDPARMHCSPQAEGGEGDRLENGCHNTIVTVSDVGGHEYAGIGTLQTVIDEEGVVPGVLPFGLFSNVHTIDAWADFGDGCTRFVKDLKTQDAPAETGCPWLDPIAPNYDPRFDAEPNPASGIRIFIGLDDNIAAGEHDSSDKISNGPSDGGAMQFMLDPATIGPWLEAFTSANPQYILTHPLPAADAGIGFCADSICFSLQTQRRVAYQGGGEGSRAAANYNGKRWDPDTCSGERDGPQDCDDPEAPGGQDITYWHNQDGTVYVEPGVQIYADPDPQGSPIGPYPFPAIYIGTCGVIVGGGPMGQVPDSDFTNPETGQFVVETGC